MATWSDPPGKPNDRSHAVGRHLVLITGCGILIVGMLGAWLTYPDPPRLNAIGLVPQLLMWTFIAASGAILAGHARGSRPSPRRIAGWLVFFALALMVAVLLAAPPLAEPALRGLLMAVPESIRDSSFFRETGLCILAGLVWAPYVMWIYAGGVHAVRLMLAASGWLFGRASSRSP